MKRLIWLGTAATVGLLGCVGNPAGTNADNPHGLPTTIALEMPGTLKSVSALTAVTPYRTQAQLVRLSDQIKGNMAVYTESTRLVEGILAAVIKHNLPEGKSFTFKDGGKTLTVLLERKSDHRVVSIGEGDAAKGAGQILGISFTSKTKGRAVFKPSEQKPGMGRFVLATTFDLDAGMATADGYSDTTVLSGESAPQKLRAHWVFERFAEAPEASPSFAFQVAAYAHRPNRSNDTGVFAIAAHFLKPGGAAAIIGIQAGMTQNKFTWVPSTDPPNFVEPITKGFYLSTDGKDLLPDQAPDALKAILPADSAISTDAFPADPSTVDALAEDAFKFPE